MAVEKQILRLLSIKADISGKELIDILETMNYTPQSIRNALSKLKKKSYVTSPKRGTYSITTNGFELYQLFNSKENFYDKQWDERWYLVFIEIPESIRNKRDAFRLKVTQLGFGQLYKGVYIYPWDITSKVLALIDSLEIENYVTILSSDTFHFNSISPEGGSGTNQASKIWNLTEIEQAYKEKQKWLEQQYHDSLDLNEPSTLLSNYLQLTEIRDALIEIDPMLPPQFLPGSWIGTHVLHSIDLSILSLIKRMPKSSSYYQYMIRP
ncbi:PaaX family transcriptional regulator C-terminal domain-containing protein [Halalkalibacter hemicellulosilyticus]|uniref:Phenylacetic acid degradation operon negative regulatory protein paaX n=1 Tax=Halalkalibacter hemicellulosilyticusJCM 9152 TaxID=1236971 RepID=W4QMN1_9BACI|nr:PaaX family transcriptional regulator C-terminal domain-containing protein [Halalkalibacter hemicellulosilyticus]GAE32594.1 phenylacetic acid degradation operon negative regulatory protein paaX [Halalkalibacter hemicellulosilyticusJCM 9152]